MAAAVLRHGMAREAPAVPVAMVGQVELCGLLIRAIFMVSCKVVTAYLHKVLEVVVETLDRVLGCMR